MSFPVESLDFRGTEIRRRPEDGYLSATDMCKATGRYFAAYYRLSATEAFLEALSSDVHIHTSKGMVWRTQKTRGGGKPRNRKLVQQENFDSHSSLRWGASWT
ncbi:hypothetical protein GS597_08985 [Synechococcales cyanobacterium C]|uniref:KilA-N domain-containing protein n=1 Tax=Petrachloros mirabilis ULC683 TaxID=2781853 RepID=A0A8K2A789_9CYAN|nr:KilA-N domain-containing protein [Petrachloros mirabilis]NCJ06636.1 hypothetical protein [Petrachloros mirabilis ULC683]